MIRLPSCLRAFRHVLRFLLVVFSDSLLWSLRFANFFQFVALDLHFASFFASVALDHPLRHDFTSASMLKGHLIHLRTPMAACVTCGYMAFPQFIEVGKNQKVLYLFVKKRHKKGTPHFTFFLCKRWHTFF